MHAEERVASGLRPFQSEVARECARKAGQGAVWAGGVVGAVCHDQDRASSDARSEPDERRGAEGAPLCDYDRGAGPFPWPAGGARPSRELAANSRLRLGAVDRRVGTKPGGKTCAELRACSWPGAVGVGHALARCARSTGKRLSSTKRLSKSAVVTQEKCRILASRNGWGPVHAGAYSNDSSIYASRV